VSNHSVVLCGDFIFSSIMVAVIIINNKCTRTNKEQVIVVAGFVINNNIKRITIFRVILYYIY
jgi:hypothetical protein